MKYVLIFAAFLIVSSAHAGMGSRKYSENAKLCSQVIPKAFDVKKLTKEEREFLIDYLVDDCYRKALERSKVTR